MTFCGGAAVIGLLMSYVVWFLFFLDVFFVFPFASGGPCPGRASAARLTAKAASPPMSRKITGANARSVGPLTIPFYETEHEA